MAINNNRALTINGQVVSYEGNVKIKAGSKKRTTHPQVNGTKITTSSVEDNYSTITVTMRVTSDTNVTFDGFFDEEDSLVISFGDKNYANCFMEELPEREDLETVDYVFIGDPEA